MMPNDVEVALDAPCTRPSCQDGVKLLQHLHFGSDYILVTFSKSPLNDGDEAFFYFTSNNLLYNQLVLLVTQSSDVADDLHLHPLAAPLATILSLPLT